jgi:hypothetical protein
MVPKLALDWHRTLLKRPGDAAGFSSASGHSISRLFWRLAPFPTAGLPVVAGDTALDHFVAPLVARHDEGSEIAAAEAERAERHYNKELQQQRVHDRPSVLDKIMAVRKLDECVMVRHAVTHHHDPA